MRRRLPIRHGPQLILTVVALLAVLVLAAFSPIIFSKLEELMRGWGRPVGIGQAYTALSALVSSLALVGVTVSLLYQARAGRTAREQSIRSLQQQLIIMEMEDPTLMTAIGAPWGLPIAPESARIREYLYVHMWTSFWAGNFVVGEISTAAARKMARAELLSSTAGRAYWSAVRENVLSTNEGKYQRFARIVDEEYWEIIRNGIPVNDPVKVTHQVSGHDNGRKNMLRQVMLAGAMLVTGVVAGRKVNKLGR
jgi:hypothetical protein